MADGGIFSVNSDSAASRNFPLGAKVMVTNLDTGRRCLVRIRDRIGAHRLVDLSPASAQRLGMDVRHPGLMHVAMRQVSAAPHRHVRHS